jgi:hypothetical protein
MAQVISGRIVMLFTERRSLLLHAACARQRDRLGCTAAEHAQCVGMPPPHIRSSSGVKESEFGTYCRSQCVSLPSRLLGTSLVQVVDVLSPLIRLTLPRLLDDIND